MVGCSGNLSSTYWVIVIRPRMSRTATTSMRNACDRSITILNRPSHKIMLVCFLNLVSKYDDANTRNHVELAHSIAVSLHKTGTGLVQRRPIQCDNIDWEHEIVMHLRFLRPRGLMCLTSLAVVELQALRRHVTGSCRRRGSAIRC